MNFPGVTNNGRLACISDCLPRRNRLNSVTKITGIDVDLQMPLYI